MRRAEAGQQLEVLATFALAREGEALKENASAQAPVLGAHRIRHVSGNLYTHARRCMTFEKNIENSMETLNCIFGRAELSQSEYDDACTWHFQLLRNRRNDEWS